jgi:hypothetical protein
MLKEWIDDECNVKLELLYKASKDGFEASKFHSHCDFKGPTISIIKSDTGNVFGGYTTIPWSNPKGSIA